jgi:hypothetical protein
MRKLRLQLDALEIASFVTTAAMSEERGTVRGRAPDTRVEPSVCIPCVAPNTEAICNLTAVTCTTGEESVGYCVEVSVPVDACYYEITAQC